MNIFGRFLGILVNWQSQYERTHKLHNSYNSESKDFQDVIQPCQKQSNPRFELAEPIRIHRFTSKQAKQH
jgi:hypothetical protein